MEVTLVEKNGTRHEFTLEQRETLTADWLKILCEKVFVNKVPVKTPIPKGYHYEESEMRHRIENDASNYEA